MDPQILALLMGSQGNALTGQQPNPMGQQTDGQDMGSLLRRAILMMRLRQMMGGQQSQQPQLPVPVGAASPLARMNPGASPYAAAVQPQPPPNALLMQLMQGGQGNMLTGGM